MHPHVAVRRQWKVAVRGAAAALATVGLASCLMVLTAPPMKPLRVDPLLPDAAVVVTDERLDDASRYAPWILHETDPEWGRQDIPASIDFDGNLIGNDNWENFSRFPLVPTVYYSVLESETHLFIAYHLFHPRDWAPVMLGFQDTHENDGENLQVVVERSGGRVALLTTQAHYRARSFAPAEGAIRSGPSREIVGEFELVDTHPVVFVESQGHGIYGSLDPCAGARLGSPVEGIVTYRPSRPEESSREPAAPYGGTHPYRLESLSAKLWPLLRAGELTGDGRLFDGDVGYRDALLSAPVPRYYDADRYSGPLGPDRGISPFALGFGFCAGDVGALTFNPARAYREAFAISGEWSLRYTDNFALRR